MAELTDQKRQLEDTMAELKKLRDETAKTLG
jgi:hypothetical protein